MLRRLLPLDGPVGALRYTVLAPALLFSQHLVVTVLYRLAGEPLRADPSFWLLPLRRLIALPTMSPWTSALTFAFSLLIAWGLAILSYRRAGRSGFGLVLAALSIIPGFQLAAVLILAILPVRAVEAEEPRTGINLAHVLQGLLAGMAIVVLAVLLSAVTFGSYGWGLFIATPFLVGLTTGLYCQPRRGTPARDDPSRGANCGGFGRARVVNVRARRIHVHRPCHPARCVDGDDRWRGWAQARRRWS